jgi:hypothetical protein
MMTLNYNDIILHNFYNKSKFKLELYSKVDSTLNLFKIHIFNKILIRSINKDFNGLFFMSSGFLKNLEETPISPLDAREIHTIFEKSLFKYRMLFSKLEKSDFLHNKKTKQLAEGLLDNYYQVEYILRKYSFSSNDNSMKNDSDKELTKLASLVSLNSLSSIN